MLKLFSCYFIEFLEYKKLDFYFLGRRLRSFFWGVLLSQEKNGKVIDKELGVGGELFYKKIKG